MRGAGSEGCGVGKGAVVLFVDVCMLCGVHVVLVLKCDVGVCIGAHCCCLFCVMGYWF